VPHKKLQTNQRQADSQQRGGIVSPPFNFFGGNTTNNAATIPILCTFLALQEAALPTQRLLLTSFCPNPCGSDVRKEALPHNGQIIG
jgi:hypothetical protein